jgi:hypothetical protein
MLVVAGGPGGQRDDYYDAHALHHELGTQRGVAT